MGHPILKVMFDRCHRASSTKEGSIEIRITYQRTQRFVTTGIRVFPHQWKDGKIIKRLDAIELQHSLDLFVYRARKTIIDLMEKGEFDMNTIAAVINHHEQKDSTEVALRKKNLIGFIEERAEIRKYGKSEDTQERYDRFVRWFRNYGKMETFADITEMSIIEMDAALNATGMKHYSKWQNYHRFLNSFICDAIADGIITKNPYRKIHIDKDKTSKSINKCLTPQEFKRIENLKPATPFLERVRDLFVFQTYTCLAYCDLVNFDPSKIMTIAGKKVYSGQRGKTKQSFTFLLLDPAIKILQKYNWQLPIISNAKYNLYLKSIFEMAGIHKSGSSHWARHTGATILLNEGVPMEIVAKILGHSSTSITRQVYAKLFDETVVKEMKRFEEIISSSQGALAL